MAGALSSTTSRAMSRRSLELADAAPLFAALGDETRLDVMERLCSGGPQSIASLTAGTLVSRQAVTKHLRILAGAGLVRDAWQGRERIWELQAKGLDDARKWLDRISQNWDHALERLRRFVEE